MLGPLIKCHHHVRTFLQFPLNRLDLRHFIIQYLLLFQPISFDFELSFAVLSDANPLLECIFPQMVKSFVVLILKCQNMLVVIPLLHLQYMLIFLFHHRGSYLFLIQIKYVDLYLPLEFRILEHELLPVTFSIGKAM